MSIPHVVLPPWVCYSEEETRDLLAHLQGLPEGRVLSFDTEWVDFDDERSNVNNGVIACATFAWFTDDECTTIQPAYVHNLDGSEDNIRVLRPLADDPKRVWTAHYAQVDWHAFMNHGIDIRGPIHCTLVMDFFVDERRENMHGLKECVRDYFGEHRKSFPETFGVPRLKKDGTPYASGERVVPSLREVAARNDSPGLVGIETLIAYAVRDAVDGLAIHHMHSFALSQQEWKQGLSMWDYFLETEVPTTRMICEAEREGMPLDLPFLRLMRAKAEVDLNATLTRITDIVGCPIKPSSDLQMRHLIYGSGGLDITKGTGKNLRVLYTIPGYAMPVYMQTDTGQPSLNKDAISDLLWRYDNEWTDDERALHPQEQKELLQALSGFSAIETQLSTFLIGLEQKALGSKVHTRLIHAGPTSGRLACVDSETPLVTFEGPKAIRNIQAGEFVRTHKGRWRKVLATFTKGPAPMVNLHLSNGEVLVCTTDHKLLTQEGSWKTVQEVLNERECVLDGDTIQHRASGGDVSLPGPTDYCRHREGPGHDVSHGLYRVAGQHPPRRAQGTGSPALLQVQAGGEEPHAGQDQGAAPQVGRSVRRRARLPDLPAQRQAGVCASGRHGGGPRSCQAPANAACAPYRREPGEQRPGQPGSGHSSRPQHDPRHAGPGRGGPGPSAAHATHRGTRLEPAYPLPGHHGTVYIESVSYAGVREVYDLSVDEDESYLACGVYSHNSRGPNIQNISAGDKDIYNLRDAFHAPPGWAFLVIDFNQLEYRLLAHVTKDPTLVRAFNDGLDLHGITHYGSFEDVRNATIRHFGRQLTLDLPLSDILEMLAWIKEEFADTRKYAKIINFETIYGVGPTKLAQQLRITKDAAWERLKGWNRTYPGVQRWKDRELRSIREKGYLRTLAGRYRRADMRRLNSEFNGVRGAEERSLLNSKIQGSARDMAVRAMLLLNRTESFKRLNPKFINQVHDELVFLVPVEKAREALAVAKKTLNNDLLPKPLAVPFPVSAGVGVSWGSAKV